VNVNLTLQVHNPSSKSIWIKPPIFLVRLGGAHVTTLYWSEVGDKPGLKKGLKIKPKKTETPRLHSQTSDELLKEKADLFVSHGEYSWNLKLEKRPPYGVLLRKRESLSQKSKRKFEARILDQQWYGMRAGTKVRLSDSKESALNSDVAGVKISLELRNLLNEAQDLRPPIVLMKSNGTTVRTFHLSGVGNKTTKRDWPAAIRFKPHETKTLHLDSGMSSKIINHRGDLLVSHRTYGWKLKIDPRPPAKVLFQKK
jgi:hypothetical protein